MSLSTFLVIGSTSSLTYNVVGHVKTVIILSGGWAFFGDEMPPKKLAGIGLAMAGIVWYSQARACVWHVCACACVCVCVCVCGIGLAMAGIVWYSQARARVACVCVCVRVCGIGLAMAGIVWYSQAHDDVTCVYVPVCLCVCVCARVCGRARACTHA